MYHLYDRNEAVLSGRIAGDPRLSHTVYGEAYYTFDLASARLSGAVDLLPHTVPERLLRLHPVYAGDFVRISGQLRSYNKATDGVNRLVLTVFTRTICEATESETCNSILLEGYLCKQATYRTTPFAREISDLMIAVNRAHNKADYLPCIAWGRNARIASTLRVGARIRAEGRIQSREYQKTDENGKTILRTAYEVSLSTLSPLDRAFPSR